MSKPKPFRILKVFGREVPVYKVANIIRDENMYGYYEDVGKYIGVDSSLKGEILDHTVIHELFHAVLDRLHVQHQLDEKFVEIIVENLSVALIDNFKMKAKE